VNSYPRHYAADVADRSIYTRTLQAAAAIVGGERALARFLRVPMSDIFVWMRPGGQPPPVSIFLRAVDIVLHDLALPDQQRAQMYRVAAAHREWSNLERVK
jgi:hypothetical protein